MLREFAPDNKSIMPGVKKNPDVKALFDEYDVTQDDEGYSRYKYDALEKKLKELLDSEELELMHARRINKNWLARQLDVRSNIFSNGVDPVSWTPRHCAKEVFRWQRPTQRTRRSTGARWCARRSGSGGPHAR